MVSTSGGKPEPIWVGTRLRPLNQTEKRKRESLAWQAVDSRTLKLQDRSEKLGPQSTATSTYDAVFGPECTTEDVYNSAAQDRVLSAMHGLNATLFVYGQTGSGKTYTMNQIVRLSASDIFDAIEQTPSREFLLKLTAVEIYNEKVRDLLAEGGERQNLSLVEDPERGVVADGCTDVGLESIKQLGQLLKQIEAKRTVRDTKMNAESSRSHQIIRIYIESRPADAPSEGDGMFVGHGEEEDLRPVKVSTINFVDLAGSERGAGSGQETTAERLRQTEGSAINKSLLTLGNVIRALGETKARGHVPFRDSKLTRMLQPSLGGNSRTAIVCTLSPVSSAVEMSKAALHFASAAKRVTMQPVVNEVLNERARIRRLQAEIDSLRQQLATRDFAEEAAQLSAALREKEQEVKLTGERDQIQRRLQNLERLILRSDKPCKDRRRSSWSEMPREGRQLPGGERQKGPLHLSWASPSSSSNATPSNQDSTSAPQQQRQPQNAGEKSDRLVPDRFISSAVRQRATPRRDMWASIVDDAHPSRQPSPEAEEPLHSIHGLQAPVGEDERVTLEALKAEARCIGRSGGGKEEPSTTMGRLKAELNILQEQVGNNYDSARHEKTAAALQTEIARLEAAQFIQRAADTALDSLKGKIAVLKLSTESEPPQEQQGAKLDGLPSWFSFGSADEDSLTLQAAESSSNGQEASSRPRRSSPGELEEEEDGPLMGSPSASPLREDASGRFEAGHPAINADSYLPVPKDLGVTPEEASTTNSQWYKTQLQRIQNKFREAAAVHVDELRAALKQQRDQVARLDWQKQLLLKQVLGVELRLDESEQARATLSTELTAAKEEAQKLRASAERAEIMDSAASSEADGSEATVPDRRRFELQASPTEPPVPAIGANWRNSPPKVPLLKLQGDVPPHMLDTNDSWNAPQSIESMLPKIMELWEALHVPLIHRSRFFLAFRGREAFYFETEKRRLAWLQSEIGDPEDRNPLKAQKAKRALARNFRKLDWEQKWLAQQVKWDFTPEEREEMFLAWNIHRDSKQRKLQLIKRLWSAETLRTPDGMQRSSELVMRLNGAEATDGMFDLVFGRTHGDSTMKTMLATGGSMLAKIATPLRASSNGSPATGLVPRRKSFLSSIAQTLTPRGRNSTAGADSGTPLRHGSMAWTPRGTSPS